MEVEIEVVVKVHRQVAQVGRAARVGGLEAYRLVVAHKVRHGGVYRVDFALEVEVGDDVEQLDVVRVELAVVGG